LAFISTDRIREVLFGVVEALGNCAALTIFSIYIGATVFTLPPESVLLVKRAACDLMVSYVTSGQINSWADLLATPSAVKAEEAVEIRDRLFTIGFEFVYDANELAFVALSRVFQLQFLKNFVESDVRHLYFYSLALATPFNLRIWVPDYERHGMQILYDYDRNFLGIINVPGATSTRDIFMGPPRAELIDGRWRRTR
jgi:hypothetical protein